MKKLLLILMLSFSPLINGMYIHHSALFITMKLSKKLESSAKLSSLCSAIKRLPWDAMSSITKFGTLGTVISGMAQEYVTEEQEENTK